MVTASSSGGLKSYYGSRPPLMHSQSAFITNDRYGTPGGLPSSGSGSGGVGGFGFVSSQSSGGPISMGGVGTGGIQYVQMAGGAGGFLPYRTKTASRSRWYAVVSCLNGCRGFLAGMLMAAALFVAYSFGEKSGSATAIGIVTQAATQGGRYVPAAGAGLHFTSSGAAAAPGVVNSGGAAPAKQRPQAAQPSSAPGRLGAAVGPGGRSLQQQGGSGALGGGEGRSDDVLASSQSAVPSYKRPGEADGDHARDHVHGSRGGDGAHPGGHGEHAAHGAGWSRGDLIPDGHGGGSAARPDWTHLVSDPYRHPHHTHTLTESPAVKLASLYPSLRMFMRPVAPGEAGAQMVADTPAAADATGAVSRRPVSAFHAPLPSTWAVRPDALPEVYRMEHPSLGHPAARLRSDLPADTARRDAVREAMAHAWRAYEAQAWGADALRPLSRRPSEAGGADGGGPGLSLSLIAALPSLRLMGFDSEFRRASEWVASSFHGCTTGGSAGVFEATSLVIGGLLSAYHLDGRTRPSLLAKARGCADRLALAFESPTGLPYASVDLRGGSAGGATAPTGEVASIQAEWEALTAASGESGYARRVRRAVSHLLVVEPPTDSLHGAEIDVGRDGRLASHTVALAGAKGDSLLGSLVRQYVLAGGLRATTGGAHHHAGMHHHDSESDDGSESVGSGAGGGGTVGADGLGGNPGMMGAAARNAQARWAHHVKSGSGSGAGAPGEGAESVGPAYEPPVPAPLGEAGVVWASASRAVAYARSPLHAAYDAAAHVGAPDPAIVTGGSGADDADAVEYRHYSNDGHLAAQPDIGALLLQGVRSVVPDDPVTGAASLSDAVSASVGEALLLDRAFFTSAWGLFLRAAAGMERAGLLATSHPSGWLFAAERHGPAHAPDPAEGAEAEGAEAAEGASLRGVMHASACSLPSTLALASLAAPSVALAQHHLRLAVQLMDTCAHLASLSAPGLPSDSVWFDGGADPSVDPSARGSSLRHETAHSLLVLFRVTGNATYREWGWALLGALNAAARVEGGGYAALEDVTASPPVRGDIQPPSLMGGTLTSLYLLFSESSALPLDRWAFSSGGFPLPVFPAPLDAARGAIAAVAGEAAVAKPLAPAGGAPAKGR